MYFSPPYFAKQRVNKEECSSSKLEIPPLALTSQVCTGHRLGLLSALDALPGPYLLYTDGRDVADYLRDVAAYLLRRYKVRYGFPSFINHCGFQCTVQISCDCDVQSIYDVQSGARYSPVHRFTDNLFFLCSVPTLGCLSWHSRAQSFCKHRRTGYTCLLA